MMIRLFLAAALTGYAAAWLLQLSTFRGGEDRHRLSSRLATGAAGLHLIALAVFWVRFRTPPLVGFGPASAVLALALVAGFLAASRTVERRSTGLLVLPLVMILLVGAAVGGLSPSEPATQLRGSWLIAHVILVLGGYASLLLASVAAAMYLFQFRALKQKEFGNVFRFFPSLESLDRMNRIGLAGGLSALAVGVMSGWGLTLAFGRGLAFGDPDVGFGLLTWTVYAIALGARSRAPGLGPRAAMVSVVASIASGLVFLAFRSLGPATEFFL